MREVSRRNVLKGAAATAVGVALVRDGTARASTTAPCGNSLGPDYLSRSGTLTIPAGQTSGTIGITRLMGNDVNGRLSVNTTV